MKFLVTGVCGQLGHDLMDELKKRGLEAVGTDILPASAYALQQGKEEADIAGEYLQADITDKEAVEKLVAGVKPDAFLHCAAWTAVDAAEDEENKPKVWAVNVTGTENIALTCRDADIPMTYISTDYVFEGLGEKPWEPDCREFAPQNYYGTTKLMGELAVTGNLKKFFIVRIAWVFGRNGNNFIRTMLKLAETHDHLRVVSDQIGTPTYTYDLARLLVDINLTDKYGCYHATNEGGYISWYDFTKEIFRQADEKEIPAISGSGKEVAYGKVEVTPVTTEEYGVSKAVRPLNSRLDKSKLKENGLSLRRGEDEWLDDSESAENLEKTIDELGLQNRTLKALKAIDIETVQDLVDYSEDQLAEESKLGKKAINEINEALKAIDLYLRNENDEGYVEEPREVNLEDLDISSRLYSAIKKVGIMDVRQLTSCTEQDLKDQGFTSKQVADIKEALEKANFYLAE